jgi:integrase
VRRHLDRKTPWRLVKKYCRAAGIDPDRLGGRGIGIHSLRKTAINDAIRNGASLHEVREFAGHADIRTTEVYFVRQGGGRRGGGTADPHPGHGAQGRVKPWRPQFARPR